MDETKINQPYASFFELVMGFVTEARKLLSNFLPLKYVKKFNWETLKLEKGDFKGGTSGLEGLFTDMLYSCQWRKHTMHIQFLLEHKSNRENFKKQVLDYLGAVYNKQRQDFNLDREAAKERGEDTSKMRFKYTPTIVIVFYHGTEEWIDYDFSDQFDIPEDEEWIRDFIPRVKVLVIDTAKISDEDIAKLESGFLQPMLFLFKHKGDKEYLLQNPEKIFKFVGVLDFTQMVKEYIKTIYLFMIQTFQLKTEEVQQITKKLPFKKSKDMQVAEKEVLNALEEAMLEGLIKGEKKGKKEGDQIGTQRTELKKNIETIVGLMKRLPDLPDIDIMIICKTDLEFVAKVRTVFQTDKEEDIKQFVREVYKIVPEMTEENYQEMEKISLQLWKEFKKD